MAWAAVTAALACRIEDRTPAGSRRDEAAIRAALRNYYAALDARDWDACRAAFWRGATFSGLADPGDTARQVASVPAESVFAALAADARRVPDSLDLQVVRTDLRQEGDLAAAWVLVRIRDRRDGAGPDEEAVEHLLLRRIAGEWRIATLARTTRSAASRL
ncbi:MAG TPA: nuclear transport factor 2 family protein [Gemmatimonadales bacterium]|nr:nuclear transport factor 2 family protein [Gemmatimonadales bacterium]